MPNEETPDQHLTERTLGSTLLHEGFLELRRDDVQLPDGRRATREYVRHGGAVAIIPLLDDDAQTRPDPRIVLARQYRHPVAKVLLELPAGKLEQGEAQLACAVRELQEETGYTAAEWAYGGEIHNAAAYSTESIWLWFARGLQAGPTRLDEGEFVETVTLPLSELLALACGTALPDVKTQIGISWLVQWRSGQRALSWHAEQGHPGL
ncbi:MAG TPA: NUDIX hydrolase [Rubrivivax sp.]|nr:NUDIX hydrolase [Rubrivivax sp.]